MFLCPRHQEWQSYILIAKQISIGNTHWIGLRSIDCIGPENGCPHCHPEGRARWNGYIHAYTPDGREEKFLCLPHGTLHRLLLGVPKDYDWRGRKLRLKRDGRAQTCRLLAELVPDFHYAGPLPDPKDPSPYLDKLFAKAHRLTTNHTAE
jgi:hypothetical protein